VIISVPNTDTSVQASGTYTLIQNGSHSVYEFTGNGSITF
jgi:hypothetical protein